MVKIATEKEDVEMSFAKASKQLIEAVQSLNRPIVVGRNIRAINATRQPRLANGTFTKKAPFHMTS